MHTNRDSTATLTAGGPAARELSLPRCEYTLEAHRSLASAEQDWRAFERQGSGHPYQTFAWLSAWDACMRPEDVQPFIILVRVGADIRMLLPLVIERHAGLTRLAPMGAGVCDYHGPLVDAGFALTLDAAAALRMLDEIATLAQVDYVLLTHVPPVLGNVRNPFAMPALQPFSADAHAVHLEADWSQFYARHRSAKTRSRLRTKENGLAKAGPIEFSQVTPPHARAAMAAEIMSLKASRLQGVAGEFNVFARPQVQDFFVRIAGETDSGDVLFFQLTAGGKLVAAVIALVRQGSFYYQVPVSVPGPFERFSPGQILVTRLLEWAVASGCSRFDFTIGDEPYKAEWCDDRWALGCMARPHTIAGHIGARLAMATIALERIVKRRPALYGFAVKLRTVVYRVRAASVRG